MSTETEQFQSAPFADQVHEFLTRYYKDKDQTFRRIRPNVWKLFDQGFDFDAIQTEKFLILDATLFDEYPSAKEKFLEELLTLNALHTKLSRICVERGQIKLRILILVGECSYAMLESNLTEFRHLFGEFRTLLMPKYFA